MQFLKTHWFAVCLGLVIAAAAFLRLYKLDALPPSLYWEEAALGYDAYSILKTGRDHHGQPWPVVAFTSFGDYKPSGYFYAIVPFIAAFGLNEWAVRLPSALAGVGSVIGVGLLARMLAVKVWPEYTPEYRRRLQIIASAMAAVSPWLLQFSRGGWEVNLAASLLLWSVISTLHARTTTRPFPFRLLGVALASAAMYTYHATRAIAPMVLLFLFAWEAWEVLTEKKKLSLALHLQHLPPIILAGISFLALASPILLQSSSSTTQQRFAETSITADGTYVKESNALREAALSSPLTQLFTHRYVMLGREVATNFFTHFRPDFLFITGDANHRHSVQFFGLLYPFDAVFLVLGSGVLAHAALKRRTAMASILFLSFWLMIGVLPAALTKATPHALRILPTAPIFFFVLAIGVNQLYTLLQQLRLPRSIRGVYPQLVVGILISTVALQFFAYWRYYTRIYPALASQDWQYGYKKMVAAVEKYNDGQTPLFITREYGRPAMYYWFYTQTDPREVQAEQDTAAKDQQEFLSFQNITFINTVNEVKPGIIASSPEGFEQLTSQFSSSERLSEIRDLRGQVVWVIVRVQE